MGIRITQHIVTNNRKIFKIYYICSSLFGLLLLAGLGNINYHDNELNRSKWIGGIIGTIQNAIILALTYFICNPWNAKVLGIIFFVLYVVYLILFAIFYKTT